MTNWFPNQPEENKLSESPSYSSPSYPTQDAPPSSPSLPPPDLGWQKKGPDKGGISRGRGLVYLGVILALAASAFAVIVSLATDDKETIIREIAAAAPSQNTVIDVNTPDINTSDINTPEVNAPTEQPEVERSSDAGLTVFERASQSVVEATVKIQATSSTGSSSGTGFFYDESGLIFTAAHVVTMPNGQTFDTVTVGLTKDGNIVRRVEGRVLGVDDNKDVGVVQIDAGEDFQVAKLGIGSRVRIGETVFAVGSPFGLDNTVTRGIISALNRTVTNQASGEALGFNLIQTDTPINPGNSGGPLANLNGEIIGINILIQNTGTGGNVGIGFAVPIAQAKEVADRIVKGEPEAEIGFLGIRGTTSVIGRAGAIVADVTSGEPADRAGLRANDLIVSVDGITIYTFSELLSAVQLHEPNDSIELGVIRTTRNEAGEAISEEMLTLNLVLGSIPISQN